jgi:hypothetical protein
MSKFIQNNRQLTRLMTAVSILVIGFGVFIALVGFPDNASAAVIRRAPNNFDLVGYWSLDDGRGSTATDFSGNGNQGTLTNMDPSTDWVDGKYGSALSFDGNDDEVTMSDDGFPVDSEPRTISAWINLRTNGSDDHIFSFGNTNDNNHTHLSSPSNGKLRMGFWFNDADSNTVLPEDEWIHVVGVYNGAQTVELYIDGDEDATRTINEASTTQPGTAYIGDSINNGEKFNGKIDEVRLYDRALTDAEVKDLYRAGRAKVNTSPKLDDIGGLVGWWTFDGDDVSGNTVYDRSGNGYDGTAEDGLNRPYQEAAGITGQSLEFFGGDN